MSKKKDPAFLFYSKDWISGTAEMLPHEKGVYIDLLCYQHQSGSLPVDTERIRRIVGLDRSEFLPIWEIVKDKFYERDGRLYNRRLEQNVSERFEMAVINRINGSFGAVVRKSKAKSFEKYEIRKLFKPEEFKHIASERLTECITEWYINRLASLGDEGGNADNLLSNTNTNIGGVGDEKKSDKISELPKTNSTDDEVIAHGNNDNNHQPAPPSAAFLEYQKNFQKSVDEIKEILQSEETWLADVCAHQNKDQKKNNSKELSINLLKEYVADFCSHLKSTGVEQNTVKESKRHFSNWLRKNLKENPVKSESGKVSYNKSALDKLRQPSPAKDA